MEKKDYRITLTVDATADEVFNSINNVAAWWTDDLKGSSLKTGDEFTVQFGDMHVSTQRITELVPAKRIVWLVTESRLSFISNQQEWNNTTISFEIDELDDGTRIHFTHIGLVPAIECYKDCSKGWDYYIKGSLYKLLTEGKGTPGL